MSAQTEAAFEALHDALETACLADCDCDEHCQDQRDVTLDDLTTDVPMTSAVSP